MLWSPFPKVPLAILPVMTAEQKMCQILNSEGKISDRSQKSHHAECSLESPFSSYRNSPALEATEAEGRALMS